MGPRVPLCSPVRRVRLSWPGAGAARNGVSAAVGADRRSCRRSAGAGRVGAPQGAAEPRLPGIAKPSVPPQRRAVDRAVSAGRRMPGHNCRRMSGDSLRARVPGEAGRASTRVTRTGRGPTRCPRCAGQGPRCPAPPFQKKPRRSPGRVLALTPAPAGCGDGRHGCSRHGGGPGLRPGPRSIADPEPARKSRALLVSGGRLAWVAGRRLARRPCSEA